jgi:hypothetical protein
MQPNSWRALYDADLPAQLEAFSVRGYRLYRARVINIFFGSNSDLSLLTCWCVSLRQCIMEPVVVHFSF